ncbi:MAG TPA: ATP-binding protein [Verrucomicrobiae bacterium]
MESKARVFEELPCGVLEFDERGKVTHANEFLCDCLGYSREEICARTFDDLLTISSRIFHQTHFFPLLKLQGEAREIYLTLRAKDERAVPVLTNARLVKNGATALIICAFMPLKERAKYEEEILAARRKAEDALKNNSELQESRRELSRRLAELDGQIASVDRRNEELRRFGEIVSHDLSEPLRKIGAFADLVASECGGTLNREGLVALERLNAACDRMAELLSILKEYLWLDAEPENPGPVDLNEVVREAAQRLQEFVALSAEPLPTIRGCRHQLTTMFNLLFRSVAARRLADKIKVRIRGAVMEENSFRKLPGKYNYVETVQITIEDDGVGFAIEKGESLFQLIRKSKAAQPHPDLAICKKVVDNHRGEISLRSPTDRGAVFTISLPVNGERESMEGGVNPG